LRTPLIAIAAALLIAACAVNPVTGKRELILVSPEREAEIGRAMAKQVADEMGLVDDDTLSSYIGEIGARIASVSPRTGVPYRFHVVDLPEPNAFALPGGYIYVSRGILALANSEDELANVMSHEVAHVAARHSAQRSTRAQGVGLLAVLGTIAAAVYGGAEAAETVGQLGQIAGAGLIASYSRDQEREADDVGQALAAKQGWDPAAMTSFLRSLGRDAALRHKGTRNPSFLDSHPSTPERIANTASRARGLPRGPGRPLAPGRAEFLARIEGTLVGPNPAGGLFEDNRFLHPDLDFHLRFPPDWATTNTRSFVGGMKQDGSAVIKLEIQAPGSDPERAAREFLASGGLEVVEHGRRSVGRLPGYHAVAVATTQEGQVAADLTWVAHRGDIYRFSGLTPVNLHSENGPLFARAVQSFRPLDPTERASINQITLGVARARMGETLQQLSRRTGNTWSPEETAVANAVEADSRTRAGQRLKIAVAVPYRSMGETR
jgi:predicted Zn-dependent protease